MFTRTMRIFFEATASAEPRKARVAARASALRDSATASCRSMDRLSAALASALGNNSGREPGTNSLLRIGQY